MNMRLTSEQEELVLKNLKLVHHIAKQFNISKSDYEDIISIGQIGLIKAAITFDKSKNTKFSAYACPSIRNEIAMHFRKKDTKINNFALSLDETIENDKGDSLDWKSMLPDTKIHDFSKQLLIDREKLSLVISIILNCLSPRDKIIYLFSVAGLTQKEIAYNFSINRFYVSRILKNSCSKIYYYLEKRNLLYRKVFSVEIIGNNFKISFCITDVCSKKIFYPSFIVDPEITKNFKFTFLDGQITIIFPLECEFFGMLGLMLYELEDFNIKYQHS